MDPIGIYRLKIFFLHPFQSLKIRDIISILSFSLIVAFLILLPSIWILPVYFVGHHWKFIEKNKSNKTLWGLKAFWFVSAGYLIASVLAVFVDPETFYADFSGPYYSSELSQEQIGLTTLIFIAAFATFGFASLYKKNYSILLSKVWDIRKSILVAICTSILFKSVTTIYVKTEFPFLTLIWTP